MTSIPSVVSTQARGDGSNPPFILTHNEEPAPQLTEIEIEIQILILYDESGKLIIHFFDDELGKV